MYRTCSTLTTPPAIQGPKVSASWRRTSREDVLMTVQTQRYMSRHPEATQLSTLTHGPLLLGGSPGTNTTPQQGDQGQAHQIYTAEDPQRHKPEQNSWKAKLE